MKNNSEIQEEEMTPIGKYSFIICFSFGTILLLGYILTRSDGFICTSIYFMGFASLANIFLLILVFINAYIINDNKRDFLKATGWILLNIPFAIGYTVIGIYLMNIAD